MPRYMIHIKEPLPPRVQRVLDLLRDGAELTADEIGVRLLISKAVARDRLSILAKVVPIESLGPYGSTRYRLKKKSSHRAKQS
jgi:hypothetical protein